MSLVTSPWPILPGMQALDCASTWLVLSVGGYEANPLVASVHPWLLAAGLKVGLVAGLAAWASHRSTHLLEVAAWLVVSAYVLVVLWNLHLWAAG